MVTVSVREITEEERQEVEDFQSFLQTVLKYFDSNRSQIKDFRSYQNLKKELKRFHNRPWINVFKNWFKHHDKRLRDHFQIRRQAVKVDKQEISKASSSAIQALKSGDKNAFLTAASKLDDTSEALIKAKEPAFDYRARNPIEIEDPLFFQSRNLVRSFSVSDMERLSKLDLNTYKYTYLEYPSRSIVNYQFMVFWISRLQDSPEDVELSDNEFDKFNKFLYDSDEYDELIELVQNYLSSNEKKLLPDILRGIKQFPKLHEENKKRRYEISEVHRGISIHEHDPYSIEDMEQIDRKTKYIATSVDYDVALRFAISIGHLEPLEAARTDGVILTYRTPPESILFDTRIFGGKFFEEEIVIDATKAEIIGDEEVFAENYQEDEEDEDY